MRMIEKVARALSISDGNHADACSNDEYETPSWNLYIESAKSAIDAMSEPTQEMVDAAKSVFVWCGDELSDNFQSEIYVKMIEAALSEADHAND